MHISHFACPPAPYLIFNSSLKRSFKRILLLYWKLYLMFFHLCERVGYFPHSFHHSYTTLIPKGPVPPLAFGPSLSLLFLTVFMLAYAVRHFWNGKPLGFILHNMLFAKVKALLVLTLIYLLIFFLAIHELAPLPAFNFISQNVLIPLLTQSFGMCFLNMDCDPRFIELLKSLYSNMNRCFRYAGCLGTTWHATNGLLQALSVVVLNCVLRPLVGQLMNITDVSVFAFADDLTVVSSSWDFLFQAFTILQSFCASTDLVLNLSKCKLWNKGQPLGSYPPMFDQLSFCLYPYSLGVH